MPSLGQRELLQWKWKPILPKEWLQKPIHVSFEFKRRTEEYTLGVWAFKVYTSEFQISRKISQITGKIQNKPGNLNL